MTSAETTFAPLALKNSSRSLDLASKCKLATKRLCIGSGLDGGGEEGFSVFGLAHASLKGLPSSSCQVSTTNNVTETHFKTVK